MKRVKITMALGFMLLVTACNDSENSESTPDTVVKESESYSIPSFGQGKIVGCGSVEKGEDESCQEDKIISSSEYILDKLSKKSKPEEPSFVKEEPLEDEEVVNKVDSFESSFQQLSLLVDEHKNKETEVGNAKDDLENLVSSVNPSELEGDGQSIGKFDTEQFKNRWEELEALVASSEDTTLKQESLKIELENLVISASSPQRDNLDEVTKQVKALIDTSIKDTSVENLNFIEHIASDMSNKKIELLESNSEWIKIKIKSGDSLSTLAEKYYGDTKRFRIIYNANREKIKNGYTILVGDTLKIPTLNSIQGI